MTSKLINKSRRLASLLRHGEAVVLAVDASAMARAGHKFFVSRNGVWLVDRVDASYVALRQ